MRKLLVLMVLGLVCVKGVYADTYIKLVSDKNESDVYVNGEIAGTYYDIPLEFILPPGDHLIEVKKENDDGSFDSFKRKLKSGKIDAKVSINAELKREYTEGYYYKNATTLSGAEAYLENYPTGKYHQKVQAFLEMAYAKKVTTIEDAKVYFEKYPKGRYQEAILNREIYLVSLKKVFRIEGVKTFTYRYDDNGNLAEDLVEESDGAWIKHSYTYNERMRLVEKVKARKGQNPEKFVYVYDGKSQLVEESIYDIEHLAYKTLYGYDENGNLIEALKEKYLHGRYLRADKITYGYDNKKNLIEKFEEHLKDGSWEKNTYTYDDKGNQITRRLQEDGYRQFDKTYYYHHPDISYTYDDKGKIREEIQSSKNGDTVAKTTYHYGENGNLVEKNTIFSIGRQAWYLYDANENLVEEYYSPDSKGETDRTIWEYTAIRLKDIYH